MERYILMNRSYRTALLQINTESLCNPEEEDTVQILEIYDSDRLPFPVQYAEEVCRQDEMRKWILKRLIPDNRDGLGILTKAAGIEDRFLLSMEGYGQNITDGFWFCPAGKNINYEDISYKSRHFSYDVGNTILGLKKSSIDTNSPDLTTNGWLKKCWRIKNGDFYLLKQGSAPHYEEPYNEVIATKVLSTFCKVPYVRYSLEKINGITCSVCKSFISENIEFVPANQLYHTKPRASFETPDMHLAERCKYFQIAGYKDFLDHMRYIDYLMANSDRHLGNFGFLYDIKRLRFIGPAPLFDHGTALWNCDEILPEKIDEQQFAEEFEKTLRKIRHPSHIKLPDADIEKIIHDTYEGSGIPEEKIKGITERVRIRQEISYAELQKASKREIIKQQKKDKDRESER